jgi:hypothetical protein
MGVVGRRLSLYCKRFFNPVAKLRAQLTSLVKTIEEVPTIQSHSLIYIVLILIILVHICAVYTCGGIGGEGFVEGCVEATLEGKGVCGSNVPSGGLNLCEQCRRTLLEAASQALPNRTHTSTPQPIATYSHVWCRMVWYGDVWWYCSARLWERRRGSLLSPAMSSSSCGHSSRSRQSSSSKTQRTLSCSPL